MLAARAAAAAAQLPVRRTPPLPRPTWGAARPHTTRPHTALRCSVEYHLRPAFLDGAATPLAFVKPLQQQHASLQHKQQQLQQRASQPAAYPRVEHAPQLSSRYELVEEVGEGSFATVWRCLDRLTGHHLAAKALPKVAGGQSMLPAIQREVDCWSVLQGSRHVNPLLGVCQDEAAVYLLQPLCRGGDLELLLMDYGSLSEQQAAGCLAVALAFLSHCRHLGVAFRDIKPANFLLLDPLPSPPTTGPPTAAATLGAASTTTASTPGGRSSWPELRVVDFGCCRMSRVGAAGVDRLEGTMLYMAPEVLQQGPAAAGPAADVWAAGVMLFELLTGRFPFWGETVDALGHLPPSAIRCGILGAEVVWPSPGAQQLSMEARHLISSLLHPDPARRPTPDAALRHPWLLARCPPPPLPSAPTLASSIAPLTFFAPTPTSPTFSPTSPSRPLPSARRTTHPPATPPSHHHNHPHTSGTSP